MAKTAMNKKIIRRISYLFLISVAMIAVISFTVVDTRGNVGGAGDSILSYDCGGSCHNSVGDGLNTMTASTVNPLTGQTIIVSISVTETSLGSSKLIGVFLLKDLSTEDSMPSADGWTILSDPNGGIKNYVEKASTVGTSMDFIWTLKVPSNPGAYRLYARVHHGPGVYYEDNSTGLLFQVAEAPSGTPTIDHTPITKAFTNKEISIEATIENAYSAFLYWKSDSEPDFDKVIKMSKVSEDSEGKCEFVAGIPSQTEVGIVEYYINATNGGLYSVTPTARITVTEEPIRPNLAAWTLQNIIILEVVVLVSFIAINMATKRGRIGNNNRREKNG